MNHFKQALRQLRQSPGFTVVAIVTMALGIGANLALFGILNEMFLRPRPVVRPHELWEVVPATETGEPMGALVYRHFFDAIKQDGQLFTEVVGYAPQRPKLKTDLGLEAIPIELVTEGYWSFLGVQPIVGRSFLPEEEALSAKSQVAVISYAFWQEYFEGDPDILGQTVTLNNVILEVVGVAPPDFTGLDFNIPRLWVPASLELVLNQKSAYYSIVGRLPEPKLVPTAEAHFSPIVAEVTDQLDKLPDEDSSRLSGISNFHQVILQSVGRGILGTSFMRVKIVRFMQFAAVAALLLLLIAGANVAGLSLARAMKRRKETATRIALGATRLDLMKPILCEGILLAAGGTLAALIAFTWTSRGLMSFMTWWPGRPLQLLPDIRVLCAAIGVTFAVGLGFSLLPALQVSRFRSGEVLKESQGTGRQRLWLRHSLIVTQVAGSLVLLCGATLCLRSMSKQLAVDLGYDHDRLVFASIDLERIGFAEDTYDSQLQTILQRVERLPGVEQVVASPYQPMVSGIRTMDSDSFTPEGYKGSNINSGFCPFVGPGLFAAMNIPMLRGREFTDRDRLGKRNKILINQKCAERFWPGQDPIGKHIVGGPVFNFEVIGVIPNVQLTLHDEEWDCRILRVASKKSMLHSCLVIRTRSNTAQLVPLVQAELARIQPKLASGKIYTIRDVLKQDLAFQHTAMRILSTLGGLALVLAAVGTYGMVAYVVNSRTREFGIRMAMGATRQHVMQQILAMGLRLGGIAVVVGVPIAWSIAIVLRHQIEGISPFDPISVILVTASVLTALIVACWVPARRAAKVDPMEALRYE